MYLCKTNPRISLERTGTIFGLATTLLVNAVRCFLQPFKLYFSIKTGHIMAHNKLVVVARLCAIGVGSAWDGLVNSNATLGYLIVLLF